MLKEFLYTVIGKDEQGNDVYNFHRILDYQAILELKKWNDEGNFDRVSEMLLLGIYCKSLDIKGKLELSKRQKLEESSSAANNFFKRKWY